MKFVVLTDIHLGPPGYYDDTLRKLNDNVKGHLEEFVIEVNQKENPEFVVVLGDLVEDKNRLEDRESIQYIVDLFKEINCPVYYVVGNHDVKEISQKELKDLLGLNRLYYSFNTGNFHFITLFPHISTANEPRIWLPEEQKEWLREDLYKTDKKAIIFTHYSLADQNLAGNLWFEGSPEWALVANREEVRGIIEDFQNVIAVFNGHLHWNRKNMHNDIPYFTIQSFVENEKEEGVPSKARAVVSIDNEQINVKVKGNYPEQFSHPI